MKDSIATVSSRNAELKSRSCYGISEHLKLSSDFQELRLFMHLKRGIEI